MAEYMKKPKVYTVDNMAVTHGKPIGVYETYFAVEKKPDTNFMLDLPPNVPKVYINELQEGEVII